MAVRGRNMADYEEVGDVSIYIIRKGYWYEDFMDIVDHQDIPFAFAMKESAENYIKSWFEHRPKNAENARITTRSDGTIEGLFEFTNDEDDKTHFYCFCNEIKIYK